jgi:uncharacterized protein (UPF0333 family)
VRRGSIALEFLLVLLAIVLYINFSVTAAQKVALQSAEDVFRMARTRAALDKFYNGVSFVASGSSGTSTTAYIYVPTGVTIKWSAGSTTVEANVPTEGNFSSLANCTDTYCIFKRDVPLSLVQAGSMGGGVVHTVIFTRVGSDVNVSVS